MTNIGHGRVFGLVSDGRCCYGLRSSLELGTNGCFLERKSLRMTLLSKLQRSACRQAFALLEQAALMRGWECRYCCPEEMILVAQGEWRVHTLHFCRPSGLPAMLLLCKFALKLPTRHHRIVYKALSKANRNLWMGHFEFVPEEGLCVFRHSLPLPLEVPPTGEQLTLMAGTAFQECESLCPVLYASIFDTCSANTFPTCSDSLHKYVSPWAGRA